MSIREKRRSRSPVHVIAAKNLADEALGARAGRSGILEGIARGAGYCSWNAYVAAGSVRLRVPLIDGGLYEVSPGLVTASSPAFRTVAKAMLRAAVREGQHCDHSAPLVISSSIENFKPFTRAAGGLVLSREIGHRRFFFAEDLPGGMVSPDIRAALNDFSGLIVLDVPGLGKRDLMRMIEAAPGAVVLSHPCGDSPDVTMTDGSARITDARGAHELAETADTGDENLGDMWRSRAVSMLLAFHRAGQSFDSRRRPDISEIDHSHPEMRSFLETIPDYDLGGNASQSEKATEHYWFISMQMQASP